ncbi:MAG: S-layer homology domain-containing protein, partial [Clostridia bacterium]|nr:S-layer homology domain-containing protein [Clostridia bacterium]
MKRRLALLTAFFVLISALSVFAQGFTDMPAADSKYYKAFEYAIGKKLIAGDGTNLNPNSLITYAEALTIVSRIKSFNCEETDVTAFGVSKDKWYYSTVAKAYTLGYITADAETGLINAESPVTKVSAFAMIARVYGKASTPVTDNSLCTRADFIWEIYWQAPDGCNAGNQPTENASEAVSEVPTEATTEYSDMKAQIAQEAKQLALGILPDGSSYTNVVVYKDETQSDWASGKVSGGSSSRPSGGGSNRPSDDDDDNDTPDEKETEAPTEDSTPTEPQTQPPTEPTEPETPEPTYGEYDGPIDNDKDNVVEDPFDDGWRPPGWVGGDDDDGDDGNSSGGGWDQEDEDFNINDADDPDYQPETDAPTQAPTDEPSDNVTDAPTDAPSDDVTDAPSDTPSDDVTDAPSDTPSD